MSLLSYSGFPCYLACCVAFTSERLDRNSAANESWLAIKCGCLLPCTYLLRPRRAEDDFISSCLYNLPNETAALKILSGFAVFDGVMEPETEAV